MVLLETKIGMNLGQPKKGRKREVKTNSVDLQKLNDACLHDPFPTLFTDEVLENVGGHEAYSFSNGFSGNHQINMVQEDKNKTTFAKEWGCY